MSTDACIYFTFLLIARSLKLFRRKPLWLISDREQLAGDNGEVLFKFIVDNHPEIDARFVLMRDSVDYRRVSKTGPIVAWDSIRRKILTLMADKLISSQAIRDFMNPFWRVNAYIGGDFIFLQHGVTKDNISGWFNAKKRKIAGIVISSRLEIAEFTRPTVGYSKENLWLTGLPRFDKLEDSAEKIVLIMPTWRAGLTINNYADSRYCKFYEGLLNNFELKDFCRSKGWKIRFIEHPNMPNYEMVNYSEELSKGGVLVTDYSSLAFDFAYLKKPVIYAQFDAAEFFSTHTYAQGFFDYRKQGFGPVTHDVESTVKAIIDTIEYREKFMAQYQNRILDFFEFFDHNNCKRVFDCLMSR